MARPLGIAVRNWELASHDRRWYIGGAFDGDGCLHITKRQLSPRLVITQADRGKVLLQEYQDMFGGAIYKGPTPQKEVHQPTWAWCLTGYNAASVCELLLPYTHLKKQQLLMGAAFQDPLTKDIKSRLAVRISQLKHVPHHPIDKPLTTAYAAGIVDTDGCISIHPTLRIGVVQKFPALTQALAETYSAGGPYRGKTSWTWCTTGKKAESILHELEPHLIVKKEQAHIAFKAQNTQNKAEYREALAALKGNQGRAPKL